VIEGDRLKPMLVVNFKTYENGTGRKGLELAKVIDYIARKNKDVEIVIAVQHTDIKEISGAVSIPVYAQHIDGIVYGSNTGFILPEAVKEAGAKGTLINHSEHRITIDAIENAINRAKEVGLKVIACANDPKIAEGVAALEPDFVAIEPPELIGSNVSVCQARPEIIEKSIECVRKVSKDIPILCGAGVHSRDDAKRAIELGSIGVLVASGIVKASNPQKVTLELIHGLIEGSI